MPFITKDVFTYFEKLYAGMNESRRERFLDILVDNRKAGNQRFAGQISIADDYILDQGGIEPEEFLTRKAIKEAFKQAKEGRII